MLPDSYGATSLLMTTTCDHAHAQNNSSNILWTLDVAYFYRAYVWVGKLDEVMPGWEPNLGSF